MRDVVERAEADGGVGAEESGDGALEFGVGVAEVDAAAAIAVVGFGDEALMTFKDGFDFGPDAACGDVGGQATGVEDEIVLDGWDVLGF